MMLRAIGLTYLVGIVLDASVSLVSMVLPRLEQASNVLSILMYGYSVIVLVLSLLGRLRPRPIFMIPVALYGFLGVAGLSVGTFLVLTHQTFPSLGQPAGFHFRSILPWYGPVEFFLLCLLLATGFLCLYKCVQSGRSTA